MEKFTTVKSVAAPLLENAIDTDVIFPARFLLLLDREGLGRHAFSERRNGPEPFVLDTSPYDTAKILVTGESFGTGSSREQAVWTIADLGIRCVIARSFGEIFFANCFKNGVLPIRLGGDDMAAVEKAAEAAEEIEIDLEAQSIRLASEREIGFDIEPNLKRLLLLGLDEVGMILAEDGDAIEAFEARRRADQPWMSIGIDKLHALAEEQEKIG
ncbi:MAG: 3-isopropylmalate dehydratase small subunit [Rhizobiaceae bacterium MnEN-MB40S]|nr:MAG: 3-isopropylmalate dehydratase small subunit [Rhizobiaceae bacterium MnEN-MB40S]